MESRGLLEVPSTSRQPPRPSISQVVQERLTHLRNEINIVEKCLETADADDFPPLRSVLLEVSKLISRLESRVDQLNVERFNLKNDIRTFQDENIHLQGALIRERRKGQRKDRTSAGRGITPPPPPPPPLKRENSLVYHSMRSFIFPPPVTRYRPLNENDSSVVDLTFDGTGSSTSTIRTSANAAGSERAWGARRVSGPCRGSRGGSLSSARRTGARRGRGTTGRMTATPRPSVRIKSGNDITQSTPGTSTAGNNGRASAPPSDNTTNENSFLSNRFNNRNNRFACNKKVFSFLNSYQPLD